MPNELERLVRAALTMIEHTHEVCPEAPCWACEAERALKDWAHAPAAVPAPLECPNCEKLRKQIMDERALQAMIDSKWQQVEECEGCKKPSREHYCYRPSSDANAFAADRFRPSKGAAVPAPAGTLDEQESISYWKVRAETAELKVLTFYEEIEGIRVGLLKEFDEGGCGRRKICQHGSAAWRPRRRNNK